MSLWEKLIAERLRSAIEKELAKELIDRHWPAIEETLRQEFAEPELAVALKAGRRACERLVEHIL